MNSDLKSWKDKLWFTVWKFQDVFVPPILRKINFGQSISSEIAICASFGALNCVNLVDFSLQKVQKCLNSKFRASRCGQIQIMRLYIFQLWFQVKSEWQENLGDSNYILLSISIFSLCQPYPFIIFTQQKTPFCKMFFPQRSCCYWIMLF